MGSSSSTEGDAHAQAMCGYARRCPPPAAAARAPGGDDDDEVLTLEVHAKVKRRGQNVFAESVEISALPEVKLTPAMTKSTRSRAVIRQALRKNFVFASFDEEEVESFVEYMEKSTVKAGERLIAQGEQGDYFYIVERGEFRFSVEGEGPVGMCRDGASFGELALLYGSPRAATVTARTAATVWRLGRVVFRATVAHATSRSKGATLEALKGVELLEGLSDDQLHKARERARATRR